jgi:hypothetical protein
VQSAAALAPLDHTPTGDCLVRVVRQSATFRPFKGTLLPTVELTYPFILGTPTAAVLPPPLPHAPPVPIR